MVDNKNIWRYLIMSNSRDVNNKFWDEKLETMPREELEAKQLEDLKEIRSIQVTPTKGGLSLDEVKGQLLKVNKCKKSK